MKFFKSLFILFLFAFPTSLNCQNNFIDSLILQIRDLQITTTDGNYREGLFPSQRCYLHGRKSIKEDDNIFFTGLIVWTLKSLYSELSSKNKSIVDSLTKKAIANYSHYQNKDGGVGFNFWQTNPSRHFPNSAYFSKRKKYKLPDDLDDSAILFLSTDFSDSLKNALKMLMAKNANTEKETIRNTFRKYKHRQAYSTWFGKNMPVDFDICVHANAMRFVLDNGFTLNKYDTATIELIKEMVLAGKHLSSPPYISPHYQKPEIILYHLARLVAAHPDILGLSEIKNQILKDAKSLYKSNSNPMSLVLLQNAMMKLNKPPVNQISVTKKDLQSFYFFVANMTSVFPNPIKGIFAKCSRTNFYYRCPAYYSTLILENEVLRLKFQ